MGLLSRRSELEVLGQQIAEVDSRIEKLGRELAEGNSQVRSLEEDISSMRNAVYQSNTAKVELNSAAAQNADRRNAMGRELPILDRELEALSGQGKRLEVGTEFASRAARPIGCGAGGGECGGGGIDAGAGHDRRAAYRELGEELTGLRVHFGQVEEKQLSLRQAVQRQTAAQAELKQQIDRVERAGAAVASRREDVLIQKQAAAHWRKSWRKTSPLMRGSPRSSRTKSPRRGNLSASFRPRWKSRGNSANRWIRKFMTWN